MIVIISATNIDAYVTHLVVDAKVLLEVESVLGHPERVPHVGLHELHAFHALVTCEPEEIAEYDL